LRSEQRAKGKGQRAKGIGRGAKAEIKRVKMGSKKRRAKKNRLTIEAEIKVAVRKGRKR
jgi:hypothetical protein